MLKRMISLSLVCAGLYAHAQETDYKRIYFSHQLPPTMPQYAGYKTFDVTVLTTKEETEAPGTGFNVAYKVKAGELAQVESGGDFHVVTLLQRFGGKLTTPSTATVNVALTTTVYNKYGAVVATGSIVNEAYAINFGRELTKDERGNGDVTRRLIMENVIEASLQSLKDGLYGSKLEPVVRLALLEDVKKNSPLKQFEEQVKAIKPAFEKEGLAGYKTAAQPYIAFWEQHSTFSEGEKEKADEVKRAALHNLALYYIATGDAAKAQTYLDQYKPIDKQIKEMMGLIKYRNSEELEKFMASINPSSAAVQTVAEGKVMSKEEVVDAHRFMIINGTVKLNGKKNAGTYEGVIKINKIPTGGFGNIAKLDPENIAVTVVTKDGAGQPLTVNGNVSQIEELKDKNGSSFITQKFGTAMLGDGAYYAFMQSSFTSPKVTVYRAVLPAGSGDYVVRKAGDDKGVKSSLLGARKDLEEYLGDCSTLAGKMKSGEIDKKTPVEKIAEAYSACAN